MAGEQRRSGLGGQPPRVDDVFHSDGDALQGAGRSVSPPPGRARRLLPGSVIVAGHHRSDGGVGTVDPGLAGVDHLDRVERPGPEALQQGRRAEGGRVAARRCVPGAPLAQLAVSVGGRRRLRTGMGYPAVAGRGPDGVTEGLGQRTQRRELVAQRGLGRGDRRHQIIWQIDGPVRDHPAVDHRKNVVDADPDTGIFQGHPQFSAISAILTLPWDYGHHPDQARP